MAHSYCGIYSPTLVYAQPATKEEFDKLALKEQVYDWKPCKATNVLKNDGQHWERRCHCKVLGDHRPDEITVIFQWWDERVAETPA